jgi:hypothetical protein
MYLRTTQRRNKDGSVVRYLALAENRRHPDKGHVEAQVIHSFGREDHAPPWCAASAACSAIPAAIPRPTARAGRRAT